MNKFFDQLDIEYDDKNKTGYFKHLLKENGNNITINFSNIPEEKYIHHIYITLLEIGRSQGRNQIKNSFRNLLQVEKNEEEEINE